MARQITRRTVIRGTVVLTLFGVIFLIPAIYRATQGEPFSWTPGVYAAIGFFLSAIINLIVNRRSFGSSGPSA
jgi:hypothetical protein